MRLMRLLTSGAGGWILLLLVLVVTCLVSAGRGILLFCSCFLVVISRVVVNHDDCEGTAPDPLVWSAGALSKRRRLVYAVRDYAMLPGPAFIRTSDWVSVLPAITAEDVGPWPSSVGILIKWVTFRGTLRWPAAGADWGLEGFPM